MAYDEKLAGRIRQLLSGANERKMFGGLAFMVSGKMCCGVLGDRLIVKVGKERHAEAIARPDVVPFDFTGRPMEGIIYVKPAGLKTKQSLMAWVEWGRETARKAKTKKIVSPKAKVGRRKGKG
jgi:TfoX/Sxy family transcriptional regulator of competence genes